MTAQGAEPFAYPHTGDVERVPHTDVKVRAVNHRSWQRVDEHDCGPQGSRSAAGVEGAKRLIANGIDVSNSRTASPPVRSRRQVRGLCVG